LDICGFNKPTRILIGKNADSLGKQNRMKKKPTPKPTIENEIDPEEWKNHTVNLIEELDDKQI
jgi:hypothetical protein